MWSAKCETLLFSKHMPDEHAVKAYFGRGQMPRSIIRPIVRCRETARRPEDQLITKWQSIHAALSTLLKHLRHKRLLARRNESVQFLSGEGADFVNEEICHCTFESQILHLTIWHQQLLRIEEVHGTIIEGMISDASSRARRQLTKIQSNITKNVREWATGAMTGSSSVGHRYLKGPQSEHNAVHEGDV
jgi:hypothetical protein